MEWKYSDGGINLNKKEDYTEMEEFINSIDDSVIDKNVKELMIGKQMFFKPILVAYAGISDNRYFESELENMVSSFSPKDMIHIMQENGYSVSLENEQLYLKSKDEEIDKKELSISFLDDLEEGLKQLENSVKETNVALNPYEQAKKEINDFIETSEHADIIMTAYFEIEANDPVQDFDLMLPNAMDEFIKEKETHSDLSFEEFVMNELEQKKAFIPESKAHHHFDNEYPNTDAFNQYYVYNEDLEGYLKTDYFEDLYAEHTKTNPKKTVDLELS